MFCNVTDPLTDYLIKTDSETSEVDTRQKCYDFCAENRQEQKASCCGIVFEKRKDRHFVEYLDTQILHCALYDAPLAPKSTEQYKWGLYFFTAVPYGDGLMAKIEDFQSLI